MAFMCWRNLIYIETLRRGWQSLRLKYHNVYLSREILEGRELDGWDRDVCRV